MFPESALPDSQVLIYTTPDGKADIRVDVAAESIWMPQATIAELFQTTQQNVSVHIGNIYEEGELDPASTARRVAVPRQEGNRTVRREVEMYNLDMIVSVGYRVKSALATRFRIWATERLVEYLVKGFTMDDERLKNGGGPGADYFDELLERIRDIRTSEKRFYQKLRDIFTLSIDYSELDTQTARDFFAGVQNKMLFSVTGQTAAEIMQARADHTKPNMGLTSWKGGRVRKGDVDIAKNYLGHGEIDELNRIVTMYLDFAENRTRRGIPMYMKDWMERLDAFLQFNERDVLTDLGSVSAAVAKATALSEYELFDQERRQDEALAADKADIAMLEELVDQLEDDPSP